MKSHSCTLATFGIVYISHSPVETFHCCVSTSGSQTQIALKAKLGLIKQPEGRIMTLTQQWRYLNLTRTAFTFYFSRNVSWVIGKSFLVASMFVLKNMFTSWRSTFKHRWIN